MKTRNLVRQKSEKVVKIPEKQLDRQDKLRTNEVENEADEMKLSWKQNIDFEADEIGKWNQ